MRALLELIDFYLENDPAARSRLSVLINYSGIHAIFYHRIAHFLYKRKWYFLARFVSQTGRFLTGGGSIFERCGTMLFYGL